MDLAGAFFNGILTTIGYVVIFFGVYKVYQAATDIREIKDLLVSSRRNPSPAAPLAAATAHGLAPEVTKDLLAEDSSVHSLWIITHSAERRWYDLSIAVGDGETVQFSW